MAWVRALTAVCRAARSARSISTTPSWAFGVPVASAGLHRAGGGVGVDRVALAVPAAGGCGRAG